VVKLNDTTTEQKDTEKLIEQIESVFAELERDWGVKVVALCTDSSGESLKV